MIDIEDVSMRPTDVDNENIDKFKEMILELYKSYDNTKSQNECKTSFTKQFHKLWDYSKQWGQLSHLDYHWFMLRIAIHNVNQCTEFSYLIPSSIMM